MSVEGMMCIIQAHTWVRTTMFDSYFARDSLDLMSYLSAIRVPRGARIYERPKKFSVTKVRKIVGSIRTALKQAQILEETIRAKRGGGMASLLVFSRSESPSFLRSAGLSDTKHGYFLLLEKGELALVLTKYTSGADAIIDEYLDRVGFSELVGLYDSAATRYEAIKMRSLTGGVGLLSRAYEASNLANVMPRAGASRSSPNRLKLTSGRHQVRVSPSTSYVAEYGGSVGVDSLFEFMDRIAKAKQQKSNPSGFIENFAAPLKLKDLPQGVEPSHVFVHTQEILDEIEDLGDLYIQEGDKLRQVTEFERPHLLSVLSDDLELVPPSADDGSSSSQVVRAQGADMGTLTLGAKSYSLILNALGSLSAGTDEVHERLDRLVSHRGMFTVTFSDPEYAYSHGTVFRNRKLPEEAAGLLSCFISIHELQRCTSEKGQLHENAVEFPADSVFAVTEGFLSGPEAIIVCDDLGDEWADHIQLRTGSEPSIAFVHSKWREGTTSSASAFHDLVGQGTKNLGNLTGFDSTRLKVKVEGWKSLYAGTTIPRIRSGHDAASLDEHYQRLAGGVATKRIMALVAPFISKQEFQSSLASYGSGGSVRSNVVQQIWILSMFVDVCRSNGVFPAVYCAP